MKTKSVKLKRIHISPHKKFDNKIEIYLLYITNYFIWKNTHVQYVKVFLPI